ncbi:hypothetical protein CPC08DRAFT_24595, partial [Agrocybe pediades]
HFNQLLIYKSSITLSECLPAQSSSPLAPETRAGSLLSSMPTSTSKPLSRSSMTSATLSPLRPFKAGAPACTWRTSSTTNVIGLLVPSSTTRSCVSPSRTAVPETATSTRRWSVHSLSTRRPKLSTQSSSSLPL